MRVNGKVFVVLLFIPPAAHSEQGPPKEEVLKTLRKATNFYVTKASIQGAPATTRLVVGRRLSECNAGQVSS